MKFYLHPASPNCMMVAMTAAQLQIELETVLVDLFRDEQCSVDFLAVNPNGLVPVLCDGDFTLWESAAIAQYLAATNPGNTLFPSDARTRADVARWQFWSHAHWMPALHPFLFENMFKRLKGKSEPDAAVLGEARVVFDRLARILDTHLTKRDFLVGSDLTLADISAASWLMYAEPARIPLDAHPSIRRWFASIRSMPSWQRAQPPAELFSASGTQPGRLDSALVQ